MSPSHSLQLPILGIVFLISVFCFRTTSSVPHSLGPHSKDPPPSGQEGKVNPSSEHTIQASSSSSPLPKPSPELAHSRAQSPRKLRSSHKGKKTRWPRSALGDYFRDHGDLYPGELLDGPHSLSVTLEGRMTQYEQSAPNKPSNVIHKDP